jgi:hypothetical protein
METALIEVKYVKPPADGKKYGSVKDATNTWWPVKIDRIRDFAADNKYEIAYTESDNGFRNIIGVKHIVPQAAPVQPKPAQRAIDAQNILLNGGSSFTTTTDLQGKQPQQQVQAKPAAQSQNGYYRPTAPRDSERMFVCAIAGHWIDTGRLDMTEEAMIALVNSLRKVYDATFGQDDTAA